MVSLLSRSLYIIFTCGLLIPCGEVAAQKTHNQLFLDHIFQFDTVYERINNNRHPIIDEWNRRANVPLGSNYCASSVGAWIIDFGYDAPKGYAWSPSWVKWGVPSKIDTGAVFTIYFPKLKRAGHVGVIITDKRGQVDCFECNTSVAGSRVGTHCIRRKRNPNTLHSVRKAKGWGG
jgi:hypothetical protein